MQKTNIAHGSQLRLFPSVIVHFCSMLTSEPGGEIFCKSDTTEIFASPTKFPSAWLPLLTVKVVFAANMNIATGNISKSINSYDLLLTVCILSCNNKYRFHVHVVRYWSPFRCLDILIVNISSSKSY